VLADVRGALTESPVAARRCSGTGLSGTVSQQTIRRMVPRNVDRFLNFLRSEMCGDTDSGADIDLSELLERRKPVDYEESIGANAQRSIFRLTSRTVSSLLSVVLWSFSPGCADYIPVNDPVRRSTTEAPMRKGIKGGRGGSQIICASPREVSIITGNAGVSPRSPARCGSARC
jgi:hypothetical protein